jgi:NAD(P)-dependent dehydrogenase (short-subunit alcohol dehydrogenase family)
MPVERRCALITGCSEGGIGFALAEEFLARGCRVYAAVRRLESARKLEAAGAVRSARRARALRAPPLGPAPLAPRCRCGGPLPSPTGGALDPPFTPQVLLRLDVCDTASIDAAVAQVRRAWRARRRGRALASAARPHPADAQLLARGPRLCGRAPRGDLAPRGAAPLKPPAARSPRAAPS